MQTDIDILSFQPAFAERIWGGQRLRTKFGMDIPPDKPIAEAWLVSDHRSHESVVDDGPLKGRTLRQLIESDARAILGSRPKLTPHGRFPLLLKILDARDWVSVQVHPDDACAEAFHEPDTGKTEMWYVLDAEPGSELWCGLRAGASPEGVRHAMESGTFDEMVNHAPVRDGSAVFVKAGTVHGIGAGIMLAEIQQNSDLTYRLYDFGRLGPDGRLRELHMDKGPKAIDFGAEWRGENRPLELHAEGGRRELLAACDYFAVERVSVIRSFVRHTGGASFHIVLPLTSGIDLETSREKKALKPGCAVLVTGNCESWGLKGKGTVLNYYVPDLGGDLLEELTKMGYGDELIGHVIF